MHLAKQQKTVQVLGPLHPSGRSSWLPCTPVEEAPGSLAPLWEKLLALSWLIPGCCNHLVNQQMKTLNLSLSPYNSAFQIKKETLKNTGINEKHKKLQYKFLNYPIVCQISPLEKGTNMVIYYYEILNFT